MKHLSGYGKRNRKELERFIKFTVVGVIGAVVDFSVFNILIGAFHLPAEVAGTISFVLAICSNFIWNRYWTYPDSRSKHIRQQFIQFFIVNVLGIVIRLPIIALTKVPFGNIVQSLLSSLESAVATALGNNMALATAVVIVMFWNFFVNRFWTYGDVGGWSEAIPVGTSSNKSTATPERQ